MEKLNKRGDRRGMTGNNPDVTGEKNPRWKGGTLVRFDGYIMVRRGSIPKSAKGARYTLLHRLIVEEMLGRKLLRSEIIHHKNHNKSDNRIENLEITTHIEHARTHIKKRRRDKKTGRIL